MKENRLRKIFGTDRRAVIVACDHASFSGPLPGLEEPKPLIEALVSSNVDAILTTVGIAQNFSAHMGKMSLILRMDGGSTIRCKNMGSLKNQFSIEDAVRLGADAVICMGMIGFSEEADSLANLAQLSAQSMAWNMPVIAEMLVKPEDGQPTTPKDIEFAIRIGAELGADVIKAAYRGPSDQFKAAVKSCYIPVVVLGGEKASNEIKLFEDIAEALDAGASGVAIGRNIWQHTNPAGMCRALVALVHGGVSVDQAHLELKD